jgi:nitrite reductase/ring-hydroxylating ferredoxin subunit
VSAVRLQNQAQFDPMDVLAAPADAAHTAGADFFENIRVRSVRSDRGDQVLDTAQGDVRAGTVILATGTPILDRGAYFARLHPERSYAAAFEVSEELPEGMFLSADQPSRSIRTVPTAEGEVLLTGGAGHTVGRVRSEQALVDDLIEWTTRSFPTARLRARWSAQDYVSMDELPYVGPLLPGYHGILVATGYAKWGMSNAVAAALMLSGQLRGEPKPWAAAMNSSRYQQFSGVASAALTNGAVGVQMVKGWAGAALAGSPAPGEAITAEGTGEIRREGSRPAAVCTVDGQQHRLSAICPHLYGILKWNDAERSWDCPLHGSRFRHDGAVLEGPATSPLRHLD